MCADPNGRSTSGNNPLYAVLNAHCSESRCRGREERYPSPVLLHVVGSSFDFRRPHYSGNAVSALISLSTMFDRTCETPGSRKTNSSRNRLYASMSSTTTRR